MMSAPEALRRLVEGNRRFVSGIRGGDAGAIQARRMELVAGQEPFAVILGCSDSRVPVEIIFDQGLGDLFVIRVAGNIATPSQIGSIEFAAERLGARLVVILGHSDCGTILATVDELQRSMKCESANLRSIIDRIRPSVEPLMGTSSRRDPGALLRDAVRANIRASANQVRSGSPIIGQLVREDGLVVVGAEYSLETGEVNFLEDPPEVG